MMEQAVFSYHLPIMVILLPLCGSLLCPAACYLMPRKGRWIVVWALAGSVICAVLQLKQIAKTGEAVHYWMGNWKPPYGIEFVVDGVNGLIILVVAVISFLTAVYSLSFEKTESEGNVRTSGYYCMLSFLAIGLLGMASTGDAFTLYVFMEVTALAGYGLIACGEGKGPIAAFRYLMTGTIGASFYLLGVGFLFAATGTLNMSDLAVKIALVQDQLLLIAAVSCMMVGFGIKMALFPLHGWQPAAHSYAHEAADPMIAGIMIKIPAYAMIRFFYCIFKEQEELMKIFFGILGVLAVCGILYGSLKALKYDTYNKILAYSSVGQVGYIAMGIAIGNYFGLAGAVLHIVSHAFMKTGLFYTSGALKYRFGVHDISSFGQLYRKMPITGAAIVIFALSMIGLPPFAGFFSKWYLAMGAIETGKYLYVAVLVISSLLNAIYFFRIFERMFMDPPKELDDQYLDNSRRKVELPWNMLIPIGVCAAGVIGIGLFQSYILTGILKTTLLEVFLL